MIITIAMIMVDSIIVGRIVIMAPHEVSGSAGPWPDARPGRPLPPVPY